MERNKLLKIVVPFFGVVLVVSGILFFYFRIYRVEPAFSVMTYEYGSAVSENIEDYLLGTDWSVHLGQLDLSGVDQEHRGSYEAYVRHGNKEYNYTITIEDTLAPVIHLKETQVYLAVDTEYPVADLIEGVSDKDIHAAAFVLQDGKEEETVSFSKVGEYHLELMAYDCSDNKSFEQLSVIVDTPPAISGIRDFYVTPGSTPDFLAEVEAVDDVDGDLTAQIEVDSTLVNLAQEGEYVLTYKAEDSYGLETLQETKILVASADSIQALIGNREINYLRDTIIGAPNIYDVGVSQEEDIKEALE